VRALAACCLAWALLLPWAAAAAVTDAAALDALMRASGLWKQLGELAPQMAAGAEASRAQDKAEGRSPVSDAEFARMKREMARAYSPERMRARVAAELGRSLDDADLPAVMAWLESPLGRRLTRLEEAESAEPLTPDRDAQLKRFAASLPEARMARLKRLAAATSAGDAGASMMINVVVGIAHGAALASPARDTAAVEALRRRLNEQRAAIVEAATRTALRQYAHAYRDVPDADLDAYLAFVESPAGLRYHDAAMVALDKAMAQGSYEFGQALAPGQAQPRGL
jgi:hypothetical protein